MDHDARRVFVWASLLCLPALYYLTRQLALRSGTPGNRRDAFILSTCLWSALLVFLTETLSIGHWLSPLILGVTWTICLSALVIAGFVIRRKNVSSGTVRISERIRNSWAELARVETVPLLSLLLLGLYLATTAMVAYVYLPNNADALGYHLPRVMHWAQHGNVYHFATNWFPEVQYGPFAEFVILNFQVILARDYLANLVQWFAMVVCVVGVSNITAKLGGHASTQIAAALLCASLPTLIMQASSNQNDLVVAYCLVCFVSLGLSMVREPGQVLWKVGTGLALGLGVLTKATALLFFMPFVVWFCAELLISEWRRAVKTAALVGLVALSLNVGYFSRNLSTYGSPVGPSRYFVIEDRSLGAILSVAIQNVAIQVPLGEPDELTGRISQHLLNWLRMLNELTTHRANDPRINMMPDHDAFTARQSYVDDVTGNPLHVMLIFAALLSVLRGRASRDLMLFCVALFVGFCASNLLKWQVWGARLVLALLVVWCAPIAALLFPTQEKKWHLVVPLLIGFFSLGWLFNNSRRPIDGQALYNRDNRGAYYESSEYYGNSPDYLRFVDRVMEAGCGRVGLQLAAGNLEYPIWRAFRERDFGGTIEHLNADAETRDLLAPGFSPCAVISDAPLAAYEGQFVSEQVSSKTRYVEPGNQIYFYSSAPE